MTDSKPSDQTKRVDRVIRSGVRSARKFAASHGRPPTEQELLGQRVQTAPLWLRIVVAALGLAAAAAGGMLLILVEGILAKIGGVLLLVVAAVLLILGILGRRKRLDIVLSRFAEHAADLTVQAILEAATSIVR